ncbi:MAG: immune inhibitor A [Anaerolineae bacterium]|nr:immune inhibitor A [Anaerolineae bacterium]
MRCLVVAVIIILLLALLCLLLGCIGAAGLAWELFEIPDIPSVPPYHDPVPSPPPAEAPGDITLQTEARLQAAVVPLHDPIALHALFATASGPSAPPTLPAYRIGDHRRFHLDGEPVDAQLVHVTAHTYTWLVEGVAADAKAIADAADYFEAHIYPAVRNAFGAEWSPGIDGDVHLSMLHYYDQEDDAAGYFMPHDELPQWVEPTSNEMEMFYINLDGMEPGEDYYFAVLAHEFQHMIHWNQDRNEMDWLDEGLAELACLLAGFDPGSSDESFHRQPDTQLNDWPYEGDDTVHYGAGYRFALYLWERFGDALIWELAHHPSNGMASLDAVLAPYGATADQVFADWVIVNALDAGDYAYRNENWSSPLGVNVTYSNYPISQNTTVLPYGTDYIELVGSGSLSIRFQGTSQTRLLPTDPPTGETFWWSNQGHQSDAHLVRQVDLSGLSSATLRFQTWYDLERGYDYVYLSASADGQRWEVLPGVYTQSGGDYGRAYNGRTDGWVEEQVDLSRYAGGPVWIRFDYVTDISINGAGFLIDDVSIPELGWNDPCDQVGDWQAAGFVLVGAMMPQRWVVQLIEFPTGGGLARVRRMALDSTQAGELEIELGGDTDRALMAISALVRHTTEPASYWYEIVLH